MTRKTEGARHARATRLRPGDGSARAFRGEMAKQSADLPHLVASLAGGLLAETPLRRKLPQTWHPSARDALTGMAFGTGASLAGQLVDRRQTGKPISWKDLGTTALFAGTASPLVGRFLRPPKG